jgi:tetratricopeptide (TPR) repeat protein
MNRLGAASTLCLLVFLAGFLWVFAPAIQANPVTLTGTVFSEENRRIEHASVKLCDGGGNRLAEEITSDSGEFTFRGLARGSYILSVSAIGYQSQDVPFDLNFNSDRGVSIYLKAVKASTNGAPAAGGNSTVSAHEMSMPQAARDLVESGKHKFWVDKNHEAGMQDLERAVALAPTYYEAHYEIGMANLMLGKQDDAERSFRESIEASGEKYGSAYVGLGSVLINEGKIKEGEQALTHGVELNPSSSLGFYELGKVRLSEKRIDEAAKSAEQARSLAPNFASVYRLLANIHLQQKNYKALLEDIDAYVKLDPDSPAGKRAREMREEIVRKLGPETAGPVASKR